MNDQTLLLAPDEIAAVLRRPPPPPDPHDLHVIAVNEGVRVKNAAVLLPLVPRDDGVKLLFTQRTAHLTSHPAQVSFPGGGVEPADVDREDTALRETEEEIGLARSHVRLLGRLPEYAMPSGFCITPVVGWIETPFDTRLDPFEVDSIFEAPLAYFLDINNYQRREYRFNGRHRRYVAIPYEGRYIWGATAGMLLSFAHMVAEDAGT